MQAVVLALDLGTKTGYAILRESGEVMSGSFNTACKSKDGPGVRWVNFRRWLVDLKTSNPDITKIVYEDVKRHVGTDAAHCYGAFRALVEMFGEHHQIPYAGVGVGTWKKHFTGNGAATKDVIVDQCRALGFRPASNDEADAIGILHYATGRCPLLTQPSPKKASTRGLKRAGAVLAAQPF